MNNSKRRIALGAFLSVIYIAAPAFGEQRELSALPGDRDGVLRVCADPNNLPLSNSAGEGFENKIAQLLARDLGWRLEYTWLPQRMGFIRNTLKARTEDGTRYKCDLVMGVPAGYELTATTQPYYRSVYAMVFRHGTGLDEVKTPADLLKLEPARLEKLKFGVVGGTPASDWLVKAGLLDQAVSYQRQTGDPQQYPGQMIEQDLMSGKVDIAFAWGPIAGYFAKKLGNVTVVPFKPDPGIRFDFPIAMGVRFGERAWKARIDQLLEQERGAIQAILADYGVPQLDVRATALELSSRNPAQ